MCWCRNKNKGESTEERNKRCERNCTFWVYGISIALLALLVISAGKVYIHTINSSNEITPLKIAAQTVQPVTYIISNDTIETKGEIVTVKAMLDTLNMRQKELSDAQKELAEHYETAVGDLRTETNNIINKVNGWLGFWMGVLALVGAIIPFVMQLFNHRREKEAFDAMVMKTNSEISNKKKELDGYKVELKRRIQELQEDTKNLQALLKTNKILSDTYSVNNSATALSHAVESKYLSDDEYREKTSRIHLAYARIKLSAITEWLHCNYEDSNISEDKKEDILHALVSVLMSINKILEEIDLHASRITHRQIISIRAQIKQIIDRAYIHADLGSRPMQRKFQCLQTSLREVGI